MRADRAGRASAPAAGAIQTVIIAERSVARPVGIGEHSREANPRAIFRRDDEVTDAFYAQTCSHGSHSQAYDAQAIIKQQMLSTQAGSRAPLASNAS